MTFVVHVDWGSPLNIVTDITVLDKPVEIQTYVPPTPRNIGLRMQYQETNEWCWMAVATSVNHFYNPASTWTQCQVMTVVGHNVNGFPGRHQRLPERGGACGPSRTGADPRQPLRQERPSSFSTIRSTGSTARYIKSGGVSGPV